MFQLEKGEGGGGGGGGGSSRWVFFSTLLSLQLDGRNWSQILEH